MWSFISLGEDRSPQAITTRVSGFRDPDEWVRRQVVAHLDSRVSEQEWMILSHALRDPVVVVRWSAALRVDELKEMRAIPRLIEMLREEKGNQVLHPAIEALGHFKAADALPELRLLAVGPKKVHLDAVLASIGNIDPAQKVAVLLELLEQEDPGIRAYAAMRLGGTNDSSAIVPLVKRLEDPDPLVCGYVVLALAAMRVESAMESMLTQLESRREAMDDMQIKMASKTSKRIVGSHVLQMDVAGIIRQVGMMPLTPDLRQRLNRLRRE